jgi:Phosphate-selective porin O and P
MWVPGLLALMTSEAVAQAPAPEAPPAPAAEAPAPAPEPPPAPPPGPAPAPPPAAEAPKQLSVGKEGFFQPGILFQFWAFLQNQNTDNAPPPDTVDTFRIRRAEFRAKGEIIPKAIGYYLMIDPARVLDVDSSTVPVTNVTPADPAEPEPSVTVFQPTLGVISILQDMMISYLSEYSDVTLGQYKIPVSWEGVNSSAKLLFPERSLVSRRYGDRRDVGVKAEKKLGDKFYYYAGLFNGNGQNKLDNNLQKDAALRLEVYPIEGLMVGGVGYMALGQRDQPNTRDRAEGDVNFEIADFLIRGEYIHAWDMNATSTDRVQGNGLAVVAGYTFADTIQPVARFGFLDPNAGTDGAGGADEVFSYEVGANYYILGNEAKAQLQLGLFDFEDAPTVYQATLAAQLNY